MFRRMERRTLAADKIAPEALANTARLHPGIVDEVIAAIARDKIVVVGMAQNPVVKKARKVLDTAGMKYSYLEYGSYVSKWKERLAIKLWAGFPTFPMVFVDGRLIGGANELEALQAKGELKS
jgi:glutaredoxin-related protein